MQCLQVFTELIADVLQIESATWLWCRVQSSALTVSCSRQVGEVLPSMQLRLPGSAELGRAFIARSAPAAALGPGSPFTTFSLTKTPPLLLPAPLSCRPGSV